MTKKYVLSVSVLLVVLAGCSQPSAAPAPQASATPIVIVITVVPTAQPTAKPTMAPATSTPSPASTATTEPAAPPTDNSTDRLRYLDDRSSPSGVIASLFNAVNTRQYVRAYSYWEDPANNDNVLPFDQFEQGYQDTDSVQVILGVSSVDAGAGQLYYDIPVVLKAQSTGRQLQSFAGCYTLHLANPGIQTEPPFQSLSIKSAVIKSIDNSIDPATALIDACPSTGNPIEPAPTTDPDTIAASNYLDDRSTPIGVLRSLFNALNRQEYSRAYSYGSADKTFEQFQQDYQNMSAIETSFGDQMEDGAAGHIYYKVPVTLKTQSPAGQTNFFTACYQLVGACVGPCTEPPFHPTGIMSMIIQPAANEAEADAQRAAVCNNLQ